MARSKHTDPPAVRSARRVAAPLDGRGRGDLKARRRAGLARRRTGAVGEPEEPAPRSGRPLHIVVRRPRRAFHHPATRQDVLGVLAAVGPLAWYGLRTVELGHSPPGAPALWFGQYHPPDRIVLVEQPLPPWRLPGRLRAGAVRRLAGAGALVTRLPGAGGTVVDWPPGTLRRFMLEEVLLHELGHHVLQRDKAKRKERIARTRDHEAFARLLASRLRAALAPPGEP